MRHTFDQTGHFAFESPTSLLYYQRGNDGARPTRLTLMEMSGGAVGGGTTLPEPADTGRRGDPEALTREFRALFDDGIVFDTENLGGAARMRALDPSVLTATVPAALAALEDGADVVAVSDRWVTPVYSGGVLHRIHVLPADPDPAQLRQWRETVHLHG
jgi:hypothetical protein